MDSKPPAKTTNDAPRKMRFAPKAPVRRQPKPIAPKPEKIEDTDAEAVHAQELFRRFNEAASIRKSKFEKKAPTKVAFGIGGGSSSIKSYGASKASGAHALGRTMEKEYQEPWNYYTYYPMTLPLRRPYSGNPEQLDEEEFGEASQSIADDESMNAAEELGLMEEIVEPITFFLQLPTTMPMIKKSPGINGQEMASGSKPLEKPCPLDELPAGCMGKMLIHKSGAVKLKLGGVSFDVSAGLNSVFAQDVAAINTEEKHCCVLGEVDKRAIITPDVDKFFEEMLDL